MVINMINSMKNILSLLMMVFTATFKTKNQTNITNMKMNFSKDETTKTHHLHRILTIFSKKKRRQKATLKLLRN